MSGCGPQIFKLNYSVNGNKTPQKYPKENIREIFEKLVSHKKNTKKKWRNLIESDTSPFMKLIFGMFKKKNYFIIIIFMKKFFYYNVITIFKKNV